uniref:26s proteasome regulatory complex subunit n=1 Tax=Rhipicephalus zambeziensis TaxID=60191 RepID=A0A224YQ29_9ACAR
MRMVIFVGSPIIASAKELGNVACHLKKEQVNVDIVNFGEYGENMGKLSSFISILNGDGTGSSHMVTVPAGNILSKVVAGTAIVQGEDSRSAINFNLDFHDDDPAFLLALRVSLEEQRLRHCQDYEARQEMAVSTDTTPAASGTASATSPAEEQELLEQPLYMETEPDDFGAAGGFTDYRTMTYDELVAYAMVMCLQNQSVPEHIASLLPDLPEEGALDTDEAEQIAEEDMDDDEYDDLFPDDMFQDPAFVMSILESLPGADTQRNVQSAPAVVTDGDQVNKPADQDEDAEDEPSEGN